MRYFGSVDLDIGLHESRANFRRRLSERYNATMTPAHIEMEAAYQQRFRDIEMATTVNQLKPVLLELLAMATR